MNLLPPAEKEELRQGLKVRSLIVSSFLVAATFLVGLILLLPSYFLARGNLAKTGEESQLLYVKNDDAANLLDLPQEINSKLEFLRSHAQERLVSDSLYEILQFSSRGITLDSVIFSRNQVQSGENNDIFALSGIAADRETLVAFSAALKASGLFAAVDVPVSSLAKDRDLPFTLNIFIEKKLSQN